MELHERLVSALLGALLGAFLGLMMAMALSLVRPLTGEQDYLVVNWLSIIAGSAVTFAVLGFAFKASIATFIGQLISWTYSRLEHRDPTDGLPWWLQVIFYAGLAAIIWHFSKGIK